MKQVSNTSLWPLTAALARMARSAFWIGVLLSLASGCSSSGDSRVELLAQSRTRTFPITSIYDGQTDVPTAEDLRVYGVHWDTLAELPGQRLEVKELPWLSLTQIADEDTPQSFLTRMISERRGTIDVIPSPFLASGRYALSVGCEGVMAHVQCPVSVRFEVGGATRVLGAWKVEDTLIITFSGAMDESTLRLEPGHVDLRVTDGTGNPLSYADERTAAVRAESRRLSIAPMPSGPFELVIGSQVRDAKGQPLDVDEDGVADTATLIRRLHPESLQTCWTRADHAAPCIPSNAANTDEVELAAPFWVQLP